jgi:hypothetical protein
MGKRVSSSCKGFDDFNFITKLDLLQDCIHELEEKYNSILTAPEKEQP